MGTAFLIYRKRKIAYAIGNWGLETVARNQMEEEIQWWKRVRNETVTGRLIEYDHQAAARSRRDEAEKLHSEKPRRK